MKIENKIKYNCVKESLIRWVLGTDGQDGATCELIDVIPWGKELESVISWNEVCDDINDSFGGRTDEKGKLWDIGIILTKADELERFMSFIIQKTNNVMKVYQGIIDKANRLCNTKYEIIVHKFGGVVDNVVKYEPIYRYFGNNLTSLTNMVYDKLKVTNWLIDDFMDSVHYGLYNNSFTVFNSGHLSENHLHLEVKKNF
jgi:hypothetical protein